MKDLTEKLRDLGVAEDTLDVILQGQLYNQCFIPKKVRAVLNRHIPKTALNMIHIDTDIAIELCLLVLSSLTSTIHDKENVGGWKHLSSEVLHNMTKNEKDNTYLYSRVIKVLKAGTKEKGPIIEVRKTELGAESYVPGEKSKQYRLTDTYRVGTETYTLTTPHLIRRRQNAYYLKLLKATENKIALNSLIFQSTVELPTEKELLAEGRRLVKLGHLTNKGKVLTMRNRNSDSNWKDITNRSFVEDNIELFKYLTDLGLMVPIVGDERSGGRVFDSFSLMPSWIRKMITINGQPIAESDYSTLHPNLANKLYGTNNEMFTHDKVAEYLNIDRAIAKTEHLSFFNKTVVQMQWSPLWDFYTNNHTEMMENIIKEKVNSEYGHKVTSMRLFQAEVELMTEVIDELNAQGIYVMYVYDALYAEASIIDEVKRVMEEVAIRQNINTAV